MKTHNTISSFCVALAAALVSHDASANTATSTPGQITIIASYTSNVTNSNYMLVSGFAATGTNCLTTGGLAYLVFRATADKDKQMLAIAMAAQVAGRLISVNVNDADKDASGKCYIQWMTLS